MPDLYSGLRVLQTESKDDLARLLADITQDFEPKDTSEKLFVRDIVSYTWDIMQYRRIMNGLMNNASRKALANVLSRILFPPSPHGLELSYPQASTLAYDSMFYPEYRDRALALLQEAGLDETAIEAEAYRLAADDLERVGRMLKAAEDGRERALRSIRKYRKNFADQIRRASDRAPVADVSSKTLN
jgi:hypothetical protein